MFYVHGIFSTNGMKIKEIEAYILALLHAFLTGMQRNLQHTPGDTLGGGEVL
jgi:hypothetical protein